MIGDVYDYNKQKVKIMSGEKRIVIFLASEEYNHWIQNGLRIGATVIFENNKIKKFL